MNPINLTCNFLLERGIFKPKEVTSNISMSFVKFLLVALKLAYFSIVIHLDFHCDWLIIGHVPLIWPGYNSAVVALSVVCYPVIVEGKV